MKIRKRQQRAKWLLRRFSIVDEEGRVDERVGHAHQTYTHRHELEIRLSGPESKTQDSINFYLPIGSILETNRGAKCHLQITKGVSILVF